MSDTPAVLSHTGGNDNKYIPVHITVTSSATAHIHEAPAAVRDGVPNANIAAVQDAKEVYHPVDARQHGQAVQVHDDVPTDGCDEQDQWRLVEDVEDKSETGSWRSIKPPIQDDPAHEAPTVGHGGVPAFSAEGVHGNLEDAGQEGHDAGDVRDDAQTAGGDNPDQARVDEAIVNAKAADKDDTNDNIVMGSEVPNQEGGGEADETLSEAKKTNAAHDDNDKKVVVGPEVQRDEKGGEDDPVLWIIETGGRKSKMTNPRLLFDNKCRSKMFKAMHENNYQEDVKYETYHRMSDMYKTFQENVMTETIKEDVVHKIYQKTTMTAMYESTFQKDKDAKAYMKNIVLPGAVADKDDPDDTAQLRDRQDGDQGRHQEACHHLGEGGITKCAST
jgi:hypothetical protein